MFYSNEISFWQHEVTFLQNFVALIGSDSVALDVIKGSKESRLGFVLTTLHKLKLNAARPTLVKPLHDAPSKEINKRL